MLLSTTLKAMCFPINQAVLKLGTRCFGEWFASCHEGLFSVFQWFASCHEGKVKGNHLFKGVGAVGEVDLRWLPCACSGCFSTTPGNCVRKLFNSEISRESVGMERQVTTETSDEALRAIVSKSLRRIEGANSVKAPGSIVAMYSNPGWFLGEVHEAPRQPVTGDIVGGKRARASRDEKDKVISVYVYDDFIDPSPAKKRKFFKAPLSVKCPKLVCGSKDCLQKKWHPQLQPVLSIRPPLVLGDEKKTAFKVHDDISAFELSPGVCQKINSLIRDLDDLANGNSKALLGSRRCCANRRAGGFRRCLGVICCCGLSLS